MLNILIFIYRKKIPMLNLTIPPQANTNPSDSTMSTNADISANNLPENEQFNKILAKEISDKSANTANTANTANSTTTPTEESPAKQSNVKTPPQTPENASKLTQYNSPKKTISLELEPELDNDIKILNIEALNIEALNIEALNIEALNIEALNIEALPDNETMSPFAAIISPTLPINASIGHIASNQGQTTGASLLASGQSAQQSSSRYIPTFNSYSSNGQQPYGAANSATFDQILPPRADANSTILTSTNESMKFTSSEFTQLGGISNLSSTTPYASSTTSMPQSLGIDSQVGQPKWGGELAQKVVWLSSQQQQVAEIRLNPAHLGPVEVMLNINSDQATVQFVSSHLAVREAIEASLPRLREMMAENGITLGDVSVGAESFQQQADTKQNNKESSSHGYDSHLTGMNDESMGKVESTISLNRHNGIVNTFA